MRPIDDRTSSGLFAQSKPAISALAPVGERSVQRILMVVVLPAPLGPRKPKSSPSSTEKEMLSTAVRDLNRFVRFCAVMIAISSNYHFILFFGTYHLMKLYVIPSGACSMPLNRLCTTGVASGT